MAYIEDFSKIRGKIEGFAWAKGLYEKMKSETDRHISAYHDDAGRRTGWGHNYVCEKCGSGLRFDPDSPREQLCPTCGHVNTGWRANDAWNSSYRGRANGFAYQAAILYRLTGDAKYLEYIKKVLTFYLENYQKLRTWVVHPMYLGRISGQHLTDDSDVINLITAMTIVRDSLSADFVEELGEKFFIPEARFLQPFCYYINNIPVWDLCAIATVGIFYGDGELTDYAFNSEFGLLKQLELGITGDGFWYEGSMHYHFYCIAPMTNLYYYARSCGCGEECIGRMGRILEKMYELPARMAFSSGMLPNPNDGWPFISLASFAGQYDTANACFDNPFIRWAASIVYDGRSPALDHEGRELPARTGGLSRLLFGIDPSEYALCVRPPVGTEVWPGINFCMLRNEDLEVFFKYGLVIASHSHFDIMNIEIAAFGDKCCYDLSTNGYGSFLFDWQQGTLSHCTVVTDTENIPKKGLGKLLEFDSAAGHIKAVNEDCYPGVDYTRELRLDGPALYDSFVCSDKTGAKHCYDYLFYCTGEQECRLDMTEADAFTEKLYDTLSDIRTARTDEDAVITYRMPGKSLDLTVRGAPGTEIYLFRSYAQSSKLFRQGVMIRRRGAAETEFSVKYEFSRL